MMLSEGEMYCLVLEDKDMLGRKVLCEWEVEVEVEGAVPYPASSILDCSIWRWYSRLLISGFPAGCAWLVAMAALTSLSERTFGDMMMRRADADISREKRTESDNELERVGCL